MPRHLRQAATLLAAAALVLATALVTAVSTAAPAFAGPETGALRSGEQLGPGQRLITPTGVALVMGTNGNLTEYAPGNRAVWALNTGIPGTLLRMQADGNLALVIPGNYPIWSTRTAGNPGATLELAADGNAAVLTTARVAKWNNGVHIAGLPTTPATTTPPTTTRPTTTPPTTTPPATTPPATTPPATTPPTTSQTTQPPAGPTAEVASLTNAERAKAGCAALRVDARLAASAQGHAADMATDNYFSHVSLDGRTFDQRIRAAGYPSPGGENIAKGYPTASAVMTGWMNSAGHKANILNCSFTTLGVGYDARGNYWVQNFGR
jgi:uncharacterized protein YkwD